MSVITKDEKKALDELFVSLTTEENLYKRVLNFYNFILNLVKKH